MNDTPVQTGPNVRRWLTKGELAEAKRIGIRTLEGFMRQGLPHFKLPRKVFFDPETVDKWFEDRFRVN